MGRIIVRRDSGGRRPQRGGCRRRRSRSPRHSLARTYSRHSIGESPANECTTKPSGALGSILIESEGSARLWPGPGAIMLRFDIVLPSARAIARDRGSSPDPAVRSSRTAALAFDGGKLFDPTSEVGRKHQSSAAALDGAQGARLDRLVQHGFASSSDRASFGDGVGQRRCFRVNAGRDAGVHETKLGMRHLDLPVREQLRNVPAAPPALLRAMAKCIGGQIR